jgi:hypothetical protein
MKGSNVVRNLKILGLTLFAALALSATAASSASAWFTWEEMETKDPPTATGSAAGIQIFHATEEEISCKKLSFDSGKVFGGYITAIPTYSECTIHSPKGTFTAHIDFTSCEYKFHTDYNIELSCPQNVEAHVYVTVLGLKLNCLTIPGQGTKPPNLQYFNEGTGASSDIRIAASVEGLEFTRQGPCGEGTVTDGGYVGEITVTGDDAKTGKQIGISWDNH